MSGIVGCFKENYSSGLLFNMLKKIEIGMDVCNEQYQNTDLGIGVGITHRKYFFEKDICFLRKSKNRCLCFYGEIYNKDLSNVDNIDSWVLDVEGIYILVEIDLKKKMIKLVTDKFGLMPMYFYVDKSGFYFSSQIKSLLVVSEINKEIDYRSIADFLHFGHVLGDKTLFKNIKLLPPGSILTFNMLNKKCSIERYWELVSVFSTDYKYSEELEQEIIHEFENSVKSRLNDLKDIGISLSGGLDSRAVLAAMKDKSKGIYSYTLGLKGCQDEKFSQKMAELCGTKHTFLEIKKQDLSDFKELANTLIFFSDGLYHPHESTEKVALDYLQKAPFKILLRGHGGEIAKASLAYPVQFCSKVFEFKSFSEIQNFIFKKANLVVNPQELSHFLNPEVMKLIEGQAWISLEQAISKCNGLLTYPDVLIYYYINQWIRRQVVASLSIFRQYVEIRLPYLDESFLRKLFKLPVNKRNEGEIHVKIVRYCSPSLIKVPNSNTGVPLDAGTLRIFLMDKFNSIMKKLSVPGFRHYTEFEKWQREYFKESIKQILFDKKTLNRGLYVEQGLQDIFQAHVNGKRNYARLLGTIVGLELWFRNFVD